MASFSGTSSGSTQLPNSSSEGDLKDVMDQRKKKRMLSNRESARRSRQRKQKHLDDLTAQVSQLRKENGQIITALNVTIQHCLGVESENSVLRTQMVELNNRLQSLNEILSYVNGSNGSCSDHYGFVSDEGMRTPWGLMGIMAPVDMFQYC